MSLANGLSILCILSKNRLLALLIFAMITFVLLQLFLGGFFTTSDSWEATCLEETNPHKVMDE